MNAEQALEPLGQPPRRRSPRRCRCSAGKITGRRSPMPRGTNPLGALAHARRRLERLLPGGRLRRQHVRHHRGGREDARRDDDGRSPRGGRLGGAGAGSCPPSARPPTRCSRPLRRPRRRSLAKRSRSTRRRPASSRAAEEAMEGQPMTQHVMSVSFSVLRPAVQARAADPAGLRREDAVRASGARQRASRCRARPESRPADARRPARTATGCAPRSCVCPLNLAARG